MTLDPSILARLCASLRAVAGGMGLVVEERDGKLLVSQGRWLLVVRDRDSAAFRGDGVTATGSMQGDGLFEPSRELWTSRYDVVARNGVNLWMPEGQSAPTYDDDALARELMAHRP